MNRTLETKRNETAVMYPGHLIAIEWGDFYEFLGSDAILASKALGITLTTRVNDALPMCGFPYWRMESDMKILNDLGHNVAVVLKDYQVRGPVREVVRVYKSENEVTK